VSQREQSLLSLVAVENEELARVNDQERVSFDTLSLLALRSAFVLPSGPLERRKRRKDKKRSSSSSKKHTSKKVCNNVWCVRSMCESPRVRERAPQYRLVAHDGSFDRLYISCLRERCAGATSFNQRVENPPDSSRR